MKQIIRIIILFITFGCTCILFTSCEKNQTRANLLDPEVKYRADTMFAHNRIAIIKEFDSLCKLQMPELIITTRDSLLVLNREQIDRILNRK